MLPRTAIEAFDRHVCRLGLRFEGVVIVGSALALMGITQRPTRDFDILVPELPALTLLEGWAMAFNRTSAPQPLPSPDELTARMAGIGMNFAVRPRPHADIETTLVHASALGMLEGDLRVLAVLTTWLGVHHTHVNAERLRRMVSAHPAKRVRAYWAAVGAWLGKDRRISRLADTYDGPPVGVLPTGNEFQIMRRGEDTRFVGSKLRVPQGTLRDRSEDVLSPEALVRKHAGYKNRVLMGSSFRADVWTALERAPDASVAEVATQALCSFAAAWKAARDFRLLQVAKKGAR